MKHALALSIGLVGTSAIALLAIVPSTAPTIATAEEAAALSIEQGEALYQQYCASCHGANLEGQANWRTPGDDGKLPAPPHDQTGHTWHHGDQLLFNYTKLGGRDLMAQRGLEFDSGMPGFKGTLTDPEIWAILDFIKSTWPEEIQDIQKQRTEMEAEIAGN